MRFESWLESQGLSESTVKKYSGAINGPLTQWGRKENIISKPISDVLDPAEFAALAELIEATDTFAERNERGNHMYSAALNNYAKYLFHLAQGDYVESSASPFSVELGHIVAAEATAAPFVPNDAEDGRERVLRAVVRRQGQPKFRSDLIEAYEGRCAITQCPVRVVLEAAHVTPYLGTHTNTVSNGLLLRADIHTLWDLGLIAIAPDSMTVSVCASLEDAAYQALAGTKVFQPIDAAHRVSKHSLKQQWELFQENAVGKSD